MKDDVDVTARAHARRPVNDVRFQKFVPPPSLLSYCVSHFVQVALMAGREAVESNDMLTKRQ